MVSPLTSQAEVSYKTNGLILGRKLVQKLIIHIVASCVFGSLTVYLLFGSPYWLSGIWTGLITIFVLVNTISLVNSSERKLTTFLQALRQNDFSLTFAEKRGSDEYELHRALNQLNTIFRNLRSERESHHQLLKVVVEQTEAPMICFDELTGEIYLVNNAALQLLHTPILKDLNSLSRVDPELLKTVRNIRDGERVSYRLSHSGKVIFVTITSCHVLFEDVHLKLIVLHDVTSELKANESETWNKLLRVLTHEISNSAIPLSTLSSHIHDVVTSSVREGRQLTAEQREDVMTSLSTIDQRSKALKEFVQNFKRVGQVPDPRFEKINAHDLIKEAMNLFSKEIERENITPVVDVREEVMIYGDRSLTLQVLINVIKNAIEAMNNMKNGKHLRILLAKEGNRFAHIRVSDSGIGIPEEDIDQVFIPFFSTKKEGSGVGLSVSRQIMQKQRGDITVESLPGAGSTFTLSFTC